MSVASPQKRKRDSQDMPDMRAAPGLGQDTSEFEQQYLHHTEDDDNQIDFSTVLSHSHNDNAIADDQPAPQHEHSDQQNSSHQRSHSHTQGVVSSASDTATAALAQYHTMTVPQPTENTFMHQPTEGGDRVSGTPVDQTPVQRSASFGDMEVNAPNGDASSPSGAQATPGGSKPTVGSDEWHKVRRDNHKEGKLATSRIRSLKLPALTPPSQSSAAAAKRSTKASTSSPKSCPGARRTKAASWRAPCSSSRS